MNKHSTVRKQFFRYVSQNILGMIGVSAYILADTFFIAQAQGADGIAALNLVLPVYSLIFALGAMLATGAATRFALERHEGKHADGYLAEALAWAVASVDNNEIDKINILNASIEGMHRALAQLSVTPEHILIDGNRFKPYRNIEHHCIVKGDGKYMAIAAASILAKTHRDEYMKKLHEEYPVYDWISNKGYPTKLHYELIAQYGIQPFYRRSFLKKQGYWPEGK